MSQPPPVPPAPPIPPRRRRSFRLRPPGADQAGKPRRPRKRSERPVPWIVGSLVVLALLVVAAIALDKHIQNSGGSAGGGAFTLITALGILAVLLIAATFFYTFRKRRRTFQAFTTGFDVQGRPIVKGRPAGSMMKWFKSHIYLGILALAVALVHALTRPWTSTITTGKITLLVFVILVLSGIAWRLVYRATPARVAGSVGNLAIVDSEARLNEIQVEIDKLAAGRSAQFQALVSARLRGGPLDIIKQQAATLPEAERPVWAEFSRLATNRDGYKKREERQQRFARFLQRWKVLHLPLAAILFGLIVVHVLDVFGAGRAAFGGAAAQFPSSKPCAACHSQIAADWRRSVMSHAVTSPLMFAQTALAVKENKIQLKAHRRGIVALGTICTACHGPIGTAITGSATLPFGTNIGDTVNPGATSAHDLILAEGVSCVICHALNSAPHVRAGATSPFPVNKSGLSTLGTVHGPVLPGGHPVPVPDHKIIAGGYMGRFQDQLKNEVVSSNLCGACHVVAVDINGDGTVDRFPNKQGKQPDLVLQTTFLEWKQQYLPTGAGEGCVTCHAPAANTPTPIANGGPFLSSLPDRIVHNHSFVGVDYDLTPGHPGQSNADFSKDLAERTALLQSAAHLEVSATVKNGKLVATVTVQNIGSGHSLPTGFAFVRQMWLQVSAHVDGTNTPVCLAPALVPGGKRVPAGSCGSGTVGPQQDLPYCDPLEVEKLDKVSGLGNQDIVLATKAGATKPVGKCDPWLASWQKILTNAPTPNNKDAIAVRKEVGFQTVTNDIVANRFRLALDPFDKFNPKKDATLQANGQQKMVPMDPPGTRIGDNRFDLVGDTEHFHYVFQVGKFKGQTVDVVAHLMFRHVPPYFLRELNCCYPDNLHARDLVKALTIVNMTPETPPNAPPNVTVARARV